ncbi:MULTISPECIES: hypothetical protein [unclassified Pseudomonas]|uniref:hypothetical protein n=1 Tax=unclassified Pseudomonas TaxID=196821 RepID=UPI00257B63B2|nr:MULTISPECIES: hypothetical protein [unclassified Pseudomonas]
MESKLVALTAFLAFCLILAFVLSERDKWVSDIATAVTAMVAIAAAFVAYVQLQESKVIAAKGIYKDYLTLSFENPEFSAASYPVDNPGYYKFKKIGENLGSKEKSYEQYEFYVSFLLNSAEEIMNLTSLEEQDGWHETLRNQFAHHALYLASNVWGCSQYDEDIYELIEEGVSSYRKRAFAEFGERSGFKEEDLVYRVPCNIID